jgi:hypothetical protein
VELARNAIPKIVNNGGYAAQDIYNQDETGQFWRQVPQRSLVTGKRAGRKQHKQRITVSLCCNAAGTDKRELFVIGKSKRPRSFPRTFQPELDRGNRYRHNSKAWMMAADLSNWVKDWNQKLQATPRKFMFIVDTAPTHVVQGVTPEQEHGLKVFSLSNIKVTSLPQNVTSKSQPCDLGNIACYKAQYRRYLVQLLLDQANKPGNEDTQLRHLTFSMYQAIHWSLQAWKQCVTAQTIQNCWRKSGLLPGLVLNPAANADAAPDDVESSDKAAEMMTDELADADAQPEVDPALVELANAIENLQT